ncbi:hypothetical protein ACN28S_01600 [Cystobacter fuscus]
MQMREHHRRTRAGSRPASRIWAGSVRSGRPRLSKSQRTGRGNARSPSRATAGESPVSKTMSPCRGCSMTNAGAERQGRTSPTSSEDIRFAPVLKTWRRRPGTATGRPYGGGAGVAPAMAIGRYGTRTHAAPPSASANPASASRT